MAFAALIYKKKKKTRQEKMRLSLSWLKFFMVNIFNGKQLKFCQHV